MPRPVYERPEFVREMKEKFKIKSLRSSGRPRKEEGKIELTPILLLLHLFLLLAGNKARNSFDIFDILLYL